MGSNPYSGYQDPMARAGLGQYSGYRDSSHTAGSSVVVDKGCQIINGWWENDKDEKVTLSQEGSNVRMVVTTSNIEDGAKVEFTVYKSIYLSSDNVIGAYTATVNQNKASKLITLIEDKVVKEDNLAEKATGTNTMIEALYFKVKITHKNGVDEKTLPMMKSQYLQVVKQAVLVSVFVEMPQDLTEAQIKASNDIMDQIGQRANDLGLSGHAAIAIDGEYYDYGPSGSFFYSPGQPWWDGFAHDQKRGKVDVSKVGGKDLDLLRKELPNIVDKHAIIYENKILVTKKQAKILKQWWDAKYKDLKTYSVVGAVGEHCTNTVMESLYEANILGQGLIEKGLYHIEVAEPVEFQENFLNDLRHQAGFLVNGKIPKNLSNIPKNAKPAPLEIIIKEKVKL